MKPVYVYGLYEWPSNIAFYVGVTVDPKRRLWSHKAALDGKRQDSLTGCGIKSAQVSMRLLASCDDRATAETIEVALQAHWGIKIVKRERLVNVSNGGMVGSKQSRKST